MERQTHRHCLLHEIHEQGMAAAGSNSPHQPREGELCHQRTNNLIDNAPVRIIGNGGEKRKQKENSPSPPSPGKLRVGNGGGRILFPLWSED